MKMVSGFLESGDVGDIRGSGAFRKTHPYPPFAGLCNIMGVMLLIDPEAFM